MKLMVLKRAMSILLVLVLVLGLSACESETVTSEYWVFEDEEVSVDNSTDDNGISNDDTSSANKKPSTSSNDSSANQKPSTSSNDSSANQKPSTNKNDDWNIPRVEVGTKGANGKDYSNYNPYADIEKYKGTKVKLATWLDPSKDTTAKVAQDFYDKYGIKIEYVFCAQDNYCQDVLALIAANNAPDIIFENDFFPSSLQIVQPISASGIDINEPVWSQTNIKSMSVNGTAYFVNATNSFDGMRSPMLVFNKDLLESNGIKTPAEYYAEGKWTLDNFKKVCQQVCALGSEYTGAFVTNTYLFPLFGSTSVSFDGKKFINTQTAQANVDALQFMTEMVQNKYIDTESTSIFTEGKTGMAISQSPAETTTGLCRNMDPDSLGFTYLPKLNEKSSQTFIAMTRGYGLSKGSKNPKAAGYAIRYLSDGENYMYKDFFVSEEAAKLASEMMQKSINSNVFVNYTGGVAKCVGSWYGYWIRGAESPDQAAVALQSHNNEVQNAVNKANELLGKAK